MDDLELPHEAAISVVYVDGDLTELEANIQAGHWSGRTCAYTAPQDIADFARALQFFADGVSDEAQFVAGTDNGIGLIAFRFYRVDRAGHIAWHIRLASGVPTNHRPEEIFRLSIEVYTESWAVGGFARQLHELGRTQKGQALLKFEV